MNKFVATAIALCIGAVSVAAQAQSTGKKQFDPYSQGAKSGEKFDPYSQGAKSGDKFDPYSQGANKSTRTDLTDASAPEAKKPATKKTKSNSKSKSKKPAASAAAAS
ncbi:amino acid ABC transporter permease [Burkholderiaceae bacterium 16]|nr:amino acid ABC transporter permease [Burkholderiaceae bacterium 16]